MKNILLVLIIMIGAYSAYRLIMNDVSKINPEWKEEKNFSKYSFGMYSSMLISKCNQNYRNEKVSDALITGSINYVFGNKILKDEIDIKVAKCVESVMSKYTPQNITYLFQKGSNSKEYIEFNKYIKTLKE